MVTILTFDMDEIPHDPERKKQLPKKQRKKRSSPKLKDEQLKKGATVAESEVDEVYRHWVAVMRPGRSRVPMLD